jgi:hypothetical protein
MNNGYIFASDLLGESDVAAFGPAASIPGTGAIRNDFGQRVFPEGFTSDCTELSPKEISDTIVYLTTVDPRMINLCLKQISDAIITCKQMGQMLRVADLKIRQFMLSFALHKNDYLGKYTQQPETPLAQGIGF